MQGIAELEEDVGVVLTLLTGTFEHLQREIDAGHFCRAYLGEGGSVESAATSDIDHLLALHCDDALNQLFPGAIHLALRIGIAIVGCMKVNWHKYLLVLCL